MPRHITCILTPILATAVCVLLPAVLGYPGLAIGGAGGLLVIWW